MELLRALGALAFITAVWLLFLVAVGYGFGVGGARQSAWTAPGQRIPGYVELRSPRLARLLVGWVPGYLGATNVTKPAPTSACFPTSASSTAGPAASPTSEFLTGAPPCP